MSTRRLLGACRLRVRAGQSGYSQSGHGHGLERARVECLDDGCRPGPAGRHDPHGDGARRRLRRRQRDRPQAPALPLLHESRRAERLEGGRRRDGGVPGARQRRPGAAAGAGAALPGQSRRHPVRGQGGRHPVRRRGGGGDDRRADERRPLRPAWVPGRRGARPVAPGAAGVRERPGGLGAVRAALPDPGRSAVRNHRALRR